MKGMKGKGRNVCRNCGKPYYITTTIAYASGKPHIGSTYEAILTDNITRYKREQGYSIFFQTGTDEYGQKIGLKVKEVGIAPQEFVDGVASQIQGIWDMMGTSYDKFIRTTDKDHEAWVQRIFKKLYDQGDIYKGYYGELYCTPCEAFFAESQLVDGKCPDCGRGIQPAKEETYFFKVSKYTDRLVQHISEHPELIQPVSRRNEMMNNFLLPGLQDLCVSRTSFTWGVPINFDLKYVTYVWLDVLTNYITDIGYNCDGNSTEQFERLRPADLYLIGRDIIRFHTIYWPILLIAPDLPLPKQIFGHPWLLQSDGKMGKSKENILYVDTLVGFFDVDAVRYFVLHEMPFDNGGVISRKLMVERMSSDLASVLRSLVNCTISMSNKHFDGVVTDPKISNTMDEGLRAVMLEAVRKADGKMEKLRAVSAIGEIFNVFKRSNKYTDETIPWALAKDEAQKGRLETVLYNLTEAITAGASLLESFMPDTSAEILTQLNTKKRSLEEMEAFGLCPSGNRVTEEPEILFARMDLKEVMEKVETVQTAQRAEAGEAESGETASEDVVDIEAKLEIEYEDFAKLQLQVDEAVACEGVPKSKKLLCSQTHVDSQVKQVVNGIKAHYSAREMVGKEIVVVVNLKPAKLVGVLSEGMLPCAEDAGENLSLMTPEKPMPAETEIC